MKKIFLFAAALLAFAGCKDEQIEPAPEQEKDEISVAPEKKDFDRKGGSVNVVVTSSGEWDLAAKDDAKYEWVTADKVTGKDGDVVKFTVDPNDGDSKLTAEFVFSCGDAEAPFTITSAPGEGDEPEEPADPDKSLIVTSDSPQELSYAAGKFEAVITLPEGADYKAVTVSIPEEATWLRFDMALEGNDDNANSARMAFSYDALEDLDPREAEVSFSYEGLEPAELLVRQLPQPVLKVDQPSQNLGIEAGTLTVNVESNVEYEVSLSEGADTWLTDGKNDGNVWTWSYSAWAEQGKREAVITFTETNPAAGAEPLTATVKVKQSNYLITTVANMRDHCAGPQDGNWAKGDVLKLGKTLTVEMLVNLDKNLDQTQNYNGDGIGALFGIERRFLIRYGDFSPQNGWELVYVKNATSGGENVEVKVQPEGARLPSEQWAHIAVVLDGEANTVTLYQDGVQLAQETMDSDIKEIDFTETYTGNEGQQRFYLGRAYSNVRDFNGKMSEVRIWNKALTSEEINAANHFYTVPADSEGLVAYWKMDEGEGNLIHDYTANGNHLYGEYFNDRTWSDGMDWVEVELP